MKEESRTCQISQSCRTVVRIREDVMNWMPCVSVMTLFEVLDVDAVVVDLLGVLKELHFVRTHYPPCTQLNA
jgi:hypothetical protein